MNAQEPIPQWATTTCGPGKTTTIRLANIESYEYDTNEEVSLRITMGSGHTIILLGDEAQEMEAALFRTIDREGRI